MIKIALVTGCLGGIGQEVCKLLSETHQVLGWDLDASLDGSSLNKFLSSYSTVDHRDLESVRAASSVITDKVDLLICMAGRALGEEAKINSSGELPHPALFQESILTNLLGHHNVVYSMTEKLKDDSSLVLVGSINAIQGYGMPAYSSAKAGLSGLAVSLAPHLGRRGIRINVAALGTVTTDNSLREWGHSKDRFVRRAKETCLERIQNPIEAAHSIVNLGGNFPNMTGQTVVIDAGATVFRADN